MISSELDGIISQFSKTKLQTAMIANKFQIKRDTNNAYMSF